MCTMVAVSVNHRFLRVLAVVLFFTVVDTRHTESRTNLFFTYRE